MFYIQGEKSNAQKKLKIAKMICSYILTQRIKHVHTASFTLRISMFTICTPGAMLNPGQSARGVMMRKVAL